MPKVIKRKDSQCELCGEFAELRPYGPKGEYICFECGMKDEKTTEKQFLKNFEDTDVVIIDAQKRVVN